jgi:hypothetical protein
MDQQGNNQGPEQQPLSFTPLAKVLSGHTGCKDAPKPAKNNLKRMLISVQKNGSSRGVCSFWKNRIVQNSKLRRRQKRGRFSQIRVGVFAGLR